MIISNFIQFLRLSLNGVKNPISLLLFRLGLKNKILINTKNLGCFLLEDNPNKIKNIRFILETQEKIDIINNQKISELKDLINQFISDSDILIYDGIKFLKNDDVINALLEDFLEDGNSPFICSLKDKVIIDIGANIGDTALKFAKQGAIVYAFEPVPPVYEMALKNIELNPSLKDCIHFFNYAVFNKKGNIEISYMGEGTSLGSSVFKLDRGGEVFNVPSITMQDIFDMMEYTPNLLQMDCEGSEYEIIPNADLSSFEEVIIEYHRRGNRQTIIDYLNKFGFNVEIFSAPMQNADLNHIGILHGFKDK